MFRKSVLMVSFRRTWATELQGVFRVLPLARAADAVSRQGRLTPVLSTSLAIDVAPIRSSRFQTRATAVDEDDQDGSFDPTKAVVMDVANMRSEDALDTIVSGMIFKALGRSVSAPDVEAALRKHFAERPINDSIVAASVRITHIQDADGRDTKAPDLADMSLTEAIAFARQHGMDLVQMAKNKDRVFCRVRNEQEAALQMVEPLVVKYRTNERNGRTSVASSSAKNGAPEIVLKEQVTVVFRDVVDAHFIKWRSEKVVKELRGRHSVKLTIEKFGTPVSGIRKMREMLEAIKTNAEISKVSHHHTTIIASERELSVIIVPNLKVAADAEAVIKHPADPDWARALAKLKDVLGGKGTVVDKSAALRPKNIGATTYRKDRFGRRKE